MEQIEKQAQDSSNINLEHKKSKKVFISFGVLFLLLIGMTGAWAVEYFGEKINKCTPSSNGICYSIIEEGRNKQKVKIEKLDDSKKYKLVVKKEMDDGTLVDVGETVLDMPNINKIVKTDPSTDEKCTDTDGGINYNQKGTLVVGDFSVSDDCSNDKDLLEVYCENNELKRKMYECPGKCEEGACVEDAPVATDCVDSDGGINYYQAGHTSWPIQAFEWDDKCFDAVTLEEGYCTSGGGIMQKTNCINGCENGACKRSGYGEMCIGENSCDSPGYQCKPSGRYSADGVYIESYCCDPSECASVIPEGNGSGDSEPHCVTDGGTDQTHSDSGMKWLECSGGEYICHAKGSVSIVSPPDIECCAGLEIKEDFYNGKEFIPNEVYEKYVCCEPSQCALDITCFDNGAEVEVETEDHSQCVNGVWEIF